MKHKTISILLASLLLCGCTTNESSKPKTVKLSNNPPIEKVESQDSFEKNEKQSDNQKKVQQKNQTETKDESKSGIVSKVIKDSNKTKQEPKVETSKQPTKTPPATSKPKPDVPDIKEPPKETVTPTPPPVSEPPTPSYACPYGKDPNLTCDTILDKNFYYKTFSSESEANNEGYYLMNEVCYIGNLEITNFSVQPVYRNDHSIAYYGLNLWSNGTMIQ